MHFSGYQRGWVLMTLLGFISLVLADTVTIVTATGLLKEQITQRAMARIDSQMRVAWHLVRSAGDDIRVADGVLMAGKTRLDDDRLVDELAQMVGGVATIFCGDLRIASNVPDRDGRRATGTRLAPGPVFDTVLRDHVSFRGTTEILGRPYYAGYDPIKDVNGDTVGMLFVGLSQEGFVAGLAHTRNTILATSLVALVIIGIGFAWLARSLGQQIRSRQITLETSNLRLDTALERMSQGLCFFDGSSRLIVANRRYAEIYDIEPASITPGMTLQDITELRRAAGSGAKIADPDYLQWRGKIARENTPNDTVVDLANGRMIAIHHQPMPDGGWVATHEDITERRKQEEKIIFLARHDALTGLANRLAFMERLEQVIGPARRSANSTVLCLNIDRFRSVNDSMGHAAGDRLLQEVAARLNACARDCDTVARLEGDTFAILLLGLSDPEKVATLARRIVEAIMAPVSFEGQPIRASVSIGIAIAPGDGNSANILLVHADMALYRAKADGRATFRFFERDMDERQQRRRLLELDLRLAVEQRQFELHYQPILDIGTGQPVCFEALLRWRHPQRGMVPPGEFIALAEETGLIVPIGIWVLKQACLDAAGWPGDIKVAVNVSPIQFINDRLADSVRAALTGASLAPRRLEVEITESVLLRDDEANLATLYALNAMGVGVAMDDFGTGYSSLSYLRSFPFDKIKIDQSFVRDLPQKAESRAIVCAITGLGRSLGMRVLAEGVETIEQLETLREAGCHDAQGYLLGRPHPASEIDATIERLARDKERMFFFEKKNQKTFNYWPNVASAANG